MVAQNDILWYIQKEMQPDVKKNLHQNLELQMKYVLVKKV